MKKKLLIIGFKDSGKTYVSEALSKRFGYRFKDSSEIMYNKILKDIYKEKYGFEDFQAYTQNKDSVRAESHDLIREYNQDNPSRLIEEILENYDIYCGLRNLYEFKGAMRKNLFDLVIWVDRKGTFESSESMQLEVKHAGYYFFNSKKLSKGAFEAKLDDLEQFIETYINT